MKMTKIPEGVQDPSKTDLARTMITSLRKKAVIFDSFIYEALYGNSIDMNSALNAENKFFVGDLREMQELAFS
jgi:hypothetical protein